MPGGRHISPIYGFVQAWTIRKTLVHDVTVRRCRIVSLYPFPILDGRLVRVGWNLSMESSVSGPREGENNSSIHTPDGHERAGSIPAAVSSSGSGLRSIPGCLSGACSSGRPRPTIAFSGSRPTTATPSGTAASCLPPVADGSRQQPGNVGAAADAQIPAVASGVTRPSAWGRTAAEVGELDSSSRAALFSSPGPTPSGVARDAYSPLGHSSGSSGHSETFVDLGAGVEGGVSLTPDEYSKLVIAAAHAKELEEERRELAEERERVARLAADAEAAHLRH